MNYYYCDKTKGFYTQDDQRVDKKSMVKMTEAEHKNIMTEQSQGGQIQLKNGKVSTKTTRVKKK